MKKITVVGCGVMGSALINALMNATFDVTIVDIVRTNAERFVARGALYAATLNESDNTDLIILNLPKHDIAKSILESTDPKKLSGQMVINTTTCLPEEVLDMDKTTSRLGMLHLDAKIENYPGDIGTTDAHLIYSGSKAVYNAAEKALQALGMATYLGEQITEASITDAGIVHAHFGAIAAIAEACSYCLKKDYPVDKFISQLRKDLPIMLEGNLRTFAKELSDYSGEFDDATECTLHTESTAMNTIKTGFNKAGVKTPCGDAVYKLLESSIANGNAKKNVVAIVNELLQ